jgi:hypothetical protein
MPHTRITSEDQNNVAIIQSTTATSESGGAKPKTAIEGAYAKRAGNGPHRL